MSLTARLERAAITYAASHSHAAQAGVTGMKSETPTFGSAHQLQVSAALLPTHLFDRWQPLPYTAVRQRLPHLSHKRIVLQPFRYLGSSYHRKTSSWTPS